MNQSIDRVAEALVIKFPSVIQIERGCDFAHVPRCPRTGATPFGDV
jgi:hypothetical protein